MVPGLAPAAALLTAALLQSAAPPPADAPPAPADAPAAPAEADGRGTVTLPPTGGERRTADRADLEETRTRITDLTNAFREKQGLEPVEPDDVLHGAAEKFGRFLSERGVLGHQAGGTTPAERVKTAGYDFCSVRENLAYQFDPFGFDAKRLAAETVTGWKESPGHRANLLADDVTQTGVAVVSDAKTGRYFAVQLFALPESAAVAFEVENRTGARRFIAWRAGSSRCRRGSCDRTPGAAPGRSRCGWAPPRNLPGRERRRHPGRPRGDRRPADARRRAGADPPADRRRRRRTGRLEPPRRRGGGGRRRGRPARPPRPGSPR